MRLSPWSLLLLLLLILCSLWPPGPCLPTWSHFDTQAPKQKGSTRLKTDKGTQGGRYGDTLCPSQCRLQKRGTLGCFGAEHVDLYQLAKCLQSLPTVEVVELLSPHFPCNCTLIHFLVLTSSAHIVTLTSPSTCSALILQHCRPMVRRIRSRITTPRSPRRMTTPRSPGSGLRDVHVMLSTDAPPLPQILWQRPASALSAIVVRMDPQKLDWARKKEQRPRESASHGHSLHGDTLTEPGYTTIYLHKRQPAAVTPNTFVKNRDKGNIGERTLDTTSKENYPTNRLKRRHTMKRNFDVKEIFDKHFDFENAFYNGTHFQTRTYSNDTVLNNSTKFESEKLFKGTSNHKGFKYFNSQERIFSGNKRTNLIIATLQPHQIWNKTRIKAGGYVESKSEAAKENAEHNSWSSSLYIENRENKTPTITHTSGAHNRTRRNARMRTRRIPNKALNKGKQFKGREGKQLKGREVAINQKNFKKQRNNLELTEFSSGIPIDNSGIFGTGSGKGTRNVAKNPTVPLSMNLETKRHVGVYKQPEKPAHARQYIPEVSKPITDGEDKSARIVMQNIHKTPQFHMPIHTKHIEKHEDAGQLGRSKRTTTHKKHRETRLKREQKRDDNEDAGNENDSENIAKDTEYKERYAREADDEEDEEEDCDDDDGDDESDSDDCIEDSMPEDKDEQEADADEKEDADGDDNDDEDGNDTDDIKGDSKNLSTAVQEVEISREKHDIFVETSRQSEPWVIEAVENSTDTNDQEKKKDVKGKVKARKPVSKAKKPVSNASKPVKHSLLFYIPKTSAKIDVDNNNETDITSTVYANNHDIRGFLFNQPPKLKDPGPAKPLKRESNQAPIDNGTQTDEKWEKALGPYSDDEVLFLLGRLQQVHQFALSPNEDSDLPYVRDNVGHLERRTSLDLDEDAEAESALERLEVKRSAPTRKRDKKGAKKDDKKGEKKDAKKEGKKDKKEEKEKVDVTVEQTKKGAVINIKDKSSSKKKGSKKGSKAKEEEEDEDDEDFEGGGHQGAFSKAVTAMTDVASSLGGILMILTIVCCCFCCRRKQTPGKREDVGFVGKLLQLAGLAKPTDDKEKLLAKDTSLTKTEEKAKPVVQEEKPTLLSAIEPAAPTPPQAAEETYKQTSEHQDFLKRLTKQRLSIFQAPVEEDETESEQTESSPQPSPQTAQSVSSSPATSKAASSTTTSSASSPSATTTSESETTDSEDKKAKAPQKKKADDKKQTDKKEKPDKKKTDKKSDKKSDKKKTDKKEKTDQKSDKKKTDKKGKTDKKSDKKSDKKKTDKKEKTDKKSDKKKPDKKKSDKKDSDKEKADKKKKKSKSKKK